MDFSMEMSIDSTMDSSMDSTCYSNSTGDFKASETIKVSDIAGFKEFTEYIIKDGRVYRFGKAKQWIGVDRKYVLLSQSKSSDIPSSKKLYKQIIDNLATSEVQTQTQTQQKVSDIAGFKEFTEYSIVNGDIYRFGKIRNWMGAAKKYVQLSQNCNLKNLYKTDLSIHLTGNSTEMWRLLNQPNVTEDDNLDIAKKMRKYLKGYRISNKGQIQICKNRTWTDICYGKYSSIYLPKDDDQFQIDRDDEDTAYEKDCKLETTQYSIRCLLEYYFDDDEIDLEINNLL